MLLISFLPAKVALLNYLKTGNLRLAKAKAEMAGEFKFSMWKVFKPPNKFLELITK